MDFLQTVAAFIVALGILVTIHEYGHFWVARRLGVKILRFSVGFGKPIWRRRAGPDDTEFVIAAVPLGGYVKMLDEREGEVAHEELDRAFNRQTLATRTAIVVAGPLANFAFAVFAYWIMYVIGITGPKPIIGEIEPGSIAAQAGLAAGFEILEVDGEPSPTWDNVFRYSIGAILDARAVTMVVRGANGFERNVELDLSQITVDEVTEGDFFERVGFEPYRTEIPAVIGRVIAGDPAAVAGLEAGDEIISVDGIAVADWIHWVDIIRENPGTTLQVVVRRAAEELSFALTPKVVEKAGETIGRIGAEVDVDKVQPVPTGVERYSPFAAVPRAFVRTGNVVTTTLKFLRKMVIGEASVRNLSGPISIAHYAGQSAKLGLSRFLDFLGLVSVSLGVLNLLPVPLLDGGHLLYYLIEFLTRRPVSETVQLYGQQVGLMLLLGLMGLAVYNDIMRIL